MRASMAVFKKEFFSYLRPSFFVILGLSAIYFSVYYYTVLTEFANISNQVGPVSQDVSYINDLLVPYLSSINFVLLLVCPFLVVRLFSEEYKADTFELLITSPISSWQIVLGKYLAACLSVTILLLLSFSYILISLPLIDIALINILTAFLGLIFLSYVYIAVSLFASSISSSVFLAGIISILLCLALWLITIFRAKEDGGISILFHEMWLGTHFLSFLKGAITSKSIVIFFSYIIFFLFLCEQVVESHRWR